MSDFIRKLLWGALVIAVILSTLYEMYDPGVGRSQVDNLPKSGFGYTSRDVPLTSAELSLYSDARVIKRWYQFGHYSFIIILVDGREDRHAVHDPLYCFNGAGWRILEKTAIDIDGGWAHKLKMSKNDEHREAIYWFSDGSSRHASITRFWFQATLNRLTLGFSGPIPFMIILQPFGDSQPNWQKILEQFGVLYEL